MKKLTTPRLTLIFAHTVRASELNAFEKRNTHYWSPWETINEKRSDEYYQDCLALWKQAFDEGRAIRFFFFLNNDANHQIIGMCNFTNIIRGPFQACYLGYKIDYAYQGKGLMTEALKEAIHYMFEEHNVHRIMANYMPSNTKSGQLLKRLGFTVEGQAKEYLLINGVWENHIMTSLINEKWKQA